MDQLTPYANNCRTHSYEQIEKIERSIGAFGFTNPILIDVKNEIIAGHGRFEAAANLGMSEVPCLVLSHLTDAQKRAYVIADNKIALEAGWDEELLAEELIALEDDDIDVSLCGFSDEELDDLIPAFFDPSEPEIEERAKKKEMPTCKSCGQKIRAN